MRFRDRQEAGWRLARALAHLRHEHPVVVGLPRGGVLSPPRWHASCTLRSTSSWCASSVTRASPSSASAPSPRTACRSSTGRWRTGWASSPPTMHRVAARERAELDRRIVRYRNVRPRVPLEGRAVILVDDGLATGSTARVSDRGAAALPVRGRSSSPSRWRRGTRSRRCGASPTPSCVCPRRRASGPSASGTTTSVR